MLKQCVKVAVVVASSVVAVPYALAVLASALYGWPAAPGGVRRALHPRYVYLLNRELLRKCRKLRYARLVLRSKWQHRRAPSTRLCKDITYGSGHNKLDMYYPEAGGVQGAAGRPVVIFVYGGSWSSGDKSMYALLCSELANTLDAVVCCPNYSIYPKGNVDDMVQDIVDCVTWVHRHAQTHGGDKSRVMLMGHSAGAHLCVMAVLELAMKWLIHQPPPALTVDAQRPEPISFEDKHFDGSNGESSNGEEPQRPATSSGSFYIVDEKREADVKNSDSFYVVGDGAGEGKMAASTDSAGLAPDFQSEAEGVATQSEAGGVATASLSDAAGGDSTAMAAAPRQSEGDVLLMAAAPRQSEGEGDVLLMAAEDGAVGGEEPRDSPDRDQTGDGAAEAEPPVTRDEPSLSESQREVKDILLSIKLVLGLSGVYHVADHYQYECERGIDGLSTMSRAMYGPQQFDRFSPTYIVHSLPSNTPLPPIELLHGELDDRVPSSSSVRFQAALREAGVSDAGRVTLVPDCDHMEICFGLMDQSRPAYGRLMRYVVELSQRRLS